GDPAVGSTIWYESGVPAGTPWSNQWGWKSDEMDQIIAKALVEIDPAKRKTLYGNFSNVANAEIPVAMTTEQMFISAVHANVRNDHNMPRWPGSSWADVWLVS